MKIDSLLNAFKDEYRITSQPLRLTESDKAATYRECELKGCGGCVLIKIDHSRLNWLEILKDADLVKKKCDYVLLSKIDGEVFFIIFEMKGKNSAIGHSQVYNTYEYLVYLIKILRNNGHCKEATKCFGVVLTSHVKPGIRATDYQPKEKNINGLRVFILPQLPKINLAKLIKTFKA